MKKQSNPPPPLPPADNHKIAVLLPTDNDNIAALGRNTQPMNMRPSPPPPPPKKEN